MKKLYLTLLKFWLIGTLLCNGQELRYQLCTNCANTTPIDGGSMAVPTNGFEYSGEVLNLESQHIASDFGKRNSGSRWHLGTDISPQGGDSDIGDRIFPIQTGIVDRIKGTSYKVIVIHGTENFGYGHIFFRGTPSVTDGMRSGDFILKLMDTPQNNFYSIIYAPEDGTPSAIGEVQGTVTVADLNNGNPITVETQITDINTPIAPIGDSGGAGSDFAAHIHLYLFEGDQTDNDFNSSYTDQNGYPITRFRNQKDPLSEINHDEPEYTVTIENYELRYPGDQSSYIQIRYSMDDQQSGSRYNTAMNVDLVELKIKNASDGTNEYQLIVGPYVESYASHGARINQDRYPSYQEPYNNETIDIADPIRIGDTETTGIRAYAYDTHPRDDFFFADFNTRIHEEDNFGRGNAVHANINQDARYEDGSYNIKAFLTTVTDQEFESEESEILIDNFLPYVEEVIVKQNLFAEKLIYRGFWQWTGSQLQLIGENLSDAEAFNDVYIEVRTSEPLENLSMEVPALSTTFDPVNNSEDRKEWNFVVNGANTDGTYILGFTGSDLAGNQLEIMNTSPLTAIPVRQANGTWNPAANPGSDQNHFFNIGNDVCSSPGGGRIAGNSESRAGSSGCLYADFRISSTSPNVNESITFEPIAAGDGALSYTWLFGEDAIPGTSNSSSAVDVVYSSPGRKTVSLQICDENNCVTEEKTDAIDVGSRPDLHVNFEATKNYIQRDEPTQLTAVYSGFGNGATLEWDFDEGSVFNYRTIPNPVVRYNSIGNKNIKLTIRGPNGTKSIVKNSFIYTYDPVPFGVEASFIGCVTSGKVGESILFTNTSYGGSKFPHEYIWNFGDGTTSTEINPSHAYENEGIYSVTLTACDDYECDTYVSSACVIINRPAGGGNVDADFRINGQLISDGSVIEVGQNTPVVFENASTLEYDYDISDISWNLNAGHTEPYKNVSVFWPSTRSYQDFTNDIGPLSITYQIEDEVYDYALIDVYLTVVYGPGYIGNKQKHAVIKVKKGLGLGNSDYVCTGEIGAVELNTSCWKGGGPYPQLTIPYSSNCDVYPIAFDLENLSRVEKTGFELAGVSSFPVEREVRVELIQDDGSVGGQNRIIEAEEYYTFTFYKSPEVDLNNINLCIGETGKIGVNSLANHSYEWSSNDSNAMSLIDDAESSNPTFSAVIPGEYTYQLIVTDLSCGCSETTSITVTVNGLNADDNSYNMASDVSEQISLIVAGGQTPYSYLWSPGQYLERIDISSPIITTPSNSEFITYNVEVTDAQGCKDYGKVYVNITSVPSDLIIEPVSFNHVLVKWQDNSPDETGFAIERSDGDQSNYRLIYVSAPNTTMYHDYEIVKGVNYYYRIKAIRPGGDTEYSNTIEVNTGELPMFSSIDLEIPAPDNGVVLTSSVRVVDFDNDGDLDISHRYLYRNDDGIFTKTSVPYFFVHDWADLDNDKDFDFIGNSGSGAHYYKNNNSNFISTGVVSSNHTMYTTFFDLDGDLNVDAFTSSGEMLENSGSGLTTYQGYHNLGLMSSMMMPIVFDAGNDKNPEVFYPQMEVLTNHYLYEISWNRNQLSGMSTLGIPEEFEQVYIDDVGQKWGDNDKGDYDLDGDIDYLGPFGIFKNDNGTLVREYLLNGNFNAKFGDFDLDGDLDVVTSGFEILKLWENQNGAFEGIFTAPAKFYTTLNWADIDGDGDLDIVYQHDNSVRMLRNNLLSNDFIVNKKPQAPQALCVNEDGPGTTLSWLPGSDSETPQEGLTYNIYVSTINGMNDFQSANAHLDDGTRKIVEFGNVGHNNSWTLFGLPDEFEWGVQSIDNNYQGSVFTLATGSTIDIPDTLNIWDEEIAAGFSNSGNPYLANKVDIRRTEVNSGANYFVKARELITLKEGFHAKKGSIFEARIGEIEPPCLSSARIANFSEIEKEDVEYSDFIEFYPNPVNDELSVYFKLDEESDVIVQVYNLAGILVKYELYNSLQESTKRIKLGHLPDGVYVVKVSTENSLTSTKKITIMH